MKKERSNPRLRLGISLMINLAIVVLEVIGAVLSFQNHGTGMFRFYTEDSNLFALLACGIYVVGAACALHDGREAPKKWIKCVKYLATCCLAVTFVVVICVLAPLYGMQSLAPMLFSGSMLYHHFLCPVLAILSFVLLETEPPLKLRVSLLALVPTLLYAAVAIVLNLVGKLHGPYPFLYVYEQPAYMSVLWCLIILGVAYLLAWLLYLGNRRKPSR